MKTAETWTSPEAVKWDLVHKPWGNLEGRTGYPGTHDISLDLVGPTIQLLTGLLANQNEVLLVTKPRYYAVKAICDVFADHPARDCILWRFTITSPDNDDLAYWEPNAPPLHERLSALAYASEAGYATSANAEPLTCLPAEVERLLETVRPLVSHSIWLGFLNGGANRLAVRDDTDRERERKLLSSQTPHVACWLYHRLRRERLIRWKDSIKRHVGLPANAEPGMDC